ncbi:MAG TPA: PASTA domain-containing protein [Burkholderiales bacterium]|nr:PASTA domain-containing protein [Burkholderiales bacterium]
MKRIFRLFVLALILIVIGLISMLTTMRLAIHRSETAVPKLIGLTPDDAERLANANGLRFVVERRFFSNEVPEGRVVSQVPGPGARVRRGWKVRVAESLGPQRAVIPNVVGQSRRAAEMTVARRALEIGTAATVHMPTSPPDVVVAQSPMAYESASSPKVDLLINAPANDQEYIMPDFTGRQLADVFDAADAVGMKIASQPVEAPGMPPSSVVRQSPAPGTRVAAGTTIRLEVAK